MEAFARRLANEIAAAYSARFARFPVMDCRDRAVAEFTTGVEPPANARRKTVARALGAKAPYPIRLSLAAGKLPARQS
jgi:hypothetical protein